VKLFEFSHTNFVTCKIAFCSESERQIDYLENNFLNPLRKAEQKMGRVILTKKDRKTLQRIHGIIETNALYLTGSNEVAGKLSFKNGKSFALLVNFVIDVTFDISLPLLGRANKFSARTSFKQSLKDVGRFLMLRLVV
jgi:hypothetical protein